MPTNTRCSSDLAGQDFLSPDGQNVLAGTGFRGGFSTAQLTEMCLTWAQGKSEGWETESLEGKGDPLNKVTG